jgi:hypothetical protein
VSPGRAWQKNGGRKMGKLVTVIFLPFIFLPPPPSEVLPLEVLEVMYEGSHA